MAQSTHGAMNPPRSFHPNRLILKPEANRRRGVRSPVVGEEFLKVIEQAKPDATVSVLVDTNVMMEIYSIGDLLVLGDKLGSQEAMAASTEFTYRLVRSRHSNLLAWWFAQTGTFGGMLGNEVVDMLEGKLAPVTDRASYAITTGIMHVIIPFIFKGMRIGPMLEVDHRAAKEDADTELLRIATVDKLPLITWEGFTQSGLSGHKSSGKLNLRGRCRDAGVVVHTPQEFLASKGINLEAEARRFCDACRAGVDEGKGRGVLMDTAAGRDVMDLLVGIYRWIMLGEVSQEYAHLTQVAWPPA